MNYKTIKNDVENQIIISKSKFITYLKRCSSQEEANVILNDIRNLHNDANHNCYAYVIGKDKSIQKCSDDGEPSQTAGVPILNVLLQNELTDVICIVTRYFGGIKLGAGGLVRAYSKSCAKAIDVANFIHKIPGYVIEITTDYKNIPKMEHYFLSNNLNIISKEYFDKVIVNIEVTSNDLDKVSSTITNLSNNTAIIEIKEEIFVEK